ncbi:hypothetical protein JCM8115_006262 [Rhodotorula mucilaginosa]|uniref:Uncharacterized protein n=1 Tax=Rhodotorula mucilaginosa TaxID=5537 RepID=A0A9P6VTH8_RHOMI|nr:hypothetical protein C6P46_001747 [Rhodotorula mucilaginosa]TKA52576.1 hypothetical protein B0A53_04586 [Rhodotorula sp. CCFEE 5036]
MSTELSVEDGNRVIERDEHGNVVSEKDYTRVQAGYKAAAHNKSLTKETRQNAETMLHDLEAQHDRVGGGGGNAGKPDDDEELEEQGSADSVGGGAPAQSHEETVHQHRVIGGLKANLHRSDRSDQTKEEIKQKLRELEADEV